MCVVKLFGARPRGLRSQLVSQTMECKYRELYLFLVSIELEQTLVQIA